MESGQPQLDIEEPQLQADGTRATLLTSRVPLSNSQGDVTGILGIYADITGRKRAEGELIAREERLRLILASTDEGIFGIDTDGRCTFANRACVETLGYQDEKDLLGQDMHTLIHHTRPDGTPHLKEDCRICQARSENKEVHIDDAVLWRADGSSFPSEYRSYPMLLLGALRSGEEPDVLQPLAPKRTADRSHGQILLSCFQCSAQ
jgi:PAS domain S-box-containing protein